MLRQPLKYSGFQLSSAESNLLKSLASKYVWWKTAAEALATPQRVLAQVMNIGDYTDVQALANVVGDDALRGVLSSAEAGQFNARSWTYWHCRLKLAELGCVPPLPSRRFGAKLTGDQVKTSLASRMGEGTIGRPEVPDNGVVQDASLVRLMAAKLQAVQRGTEAQAYVEVSGLIERGVSLAQGLAAARLLYGPNFQPSEVLKALTYFEESDLRTLPAAVKARLVAAAIAVRDLPGI